LWRPPAQLVNVCIMSWMNAIACIMCVTQRHYSQLKDELQKLTRPTEHGVAETVAAGDLVSSDATYSVAVNGNTVSSTSESAADGCEPADEMHDAWSSLPTSDASSAVASTSSTAVTDASVECDSVVTDSSSAALA